MATQGGGASGEVVAQQLLKVIDATLKAAEKMPANKNRAEDMRNLAAAVHHLIDSRHTVLIDLAIEEELQVNADAASQRRHWQKRLFAGDEPA